MNGENQIGISLQKLTETLDDGKVVQINTLERRENESYFQIVQRVYQESVPMLTEGVKKLLAGADLESSDKLGKLYTSPGL